MVVDKREENKMEEPKKEDKIIITKRGIKIEGEWTVGEILAVANMLSQEVQKVKIKGD